MEWALGVSFSLLASLLILAGFWIVIPRTLARPIEQRMQEELVFKGSPFDRRAAGELKSPASMGLRRER